MQLHLGGNGLGDAGAVAIAQALATMTAIQVVDLGSNDIGELGGKALAGAAGLCRSRCGGWGGVGLEEGEDAR